MRIAVVGAGISGLGAAWLLGRAHDVVLFEREPRLGGHADTILADAPEGPVPIDMGFIVYNTACYQNLIALFDHLGVRTAPTSMSFSVSLYSGLYEYSGSGLSGLFGQPANLLDPRHWRMVRDIFRFFKEARAISQPDAGAHAATGPTLGQFLEAKGFSRAFIERHILPMGAAIWSTPAEEMLRYPAHSFARFFANHGLLQAYGQPQWRTVAGGSREYVARLASAFSGKVVSGDPVVRIERQPRGVAITTRAGGVQRFDTCLMATHADETLRLLSDADEEERAHLGAIRYQRNETVLHTDGTHMPRRRRLWSSWNYLGQERSDRLAVTYWMNNLQRLATGQDYFVTLNPVTPIPDAKVVRRTVYEHPTFDARAVAARRALWALQGRRRTWFAGAYFGSGFHEDGLQAGFAAAESLGGVRRPWVVVGESDRLDLTARPAWLPPGELEAAE